MFFLSLCDETPSMVWLPMFFLKTFRISEYGLSERLCFNYRNIEYRASKLGKLLDYRGIGYQTQTVGLLDIGYQKNYQLPYSSKNDLFEANYLAIAGFNVRGWCGEITTRSGCAWRRTSLLTATMVISSQAIVLTDYLKPFSGLRIMK